MALANLQIVDSTPEALGSWQLATPLAAEGTGLTAAELTLGPVLTSSYTVSPNIFAVSRFGKIEMQFWGDNADNNQTINFDVYGWSQDGSGIKLLNMIVRFGNFTSAANTGFHTNAHKSIMDNFDQGTAYRGTDIYTIFNDWESIVTVFGGREADFPSKMILDLVNGQYNYLGVRLTGGTQVGNVASIFKPLSLKKTNPQRVT